MGRAAHGAAAQHRLGRVVAHVCGQEGRRAGSLPRLSLTRGPPAPEPRPPVFNPSVPNRRIVAIGGGLAADKPWVRDQIIAMTRKASPTVTYIGTPSYDSDDGYQRQAAGFGAVGLQTEHLKLTDLEALPPAGEIARAIGSADIIVVSGGNPLFAIRRWRRLGVDNLLRDAMEAGAVLCGGSCGAICWFNSGHSDALAPTTVHPDNRDPALVEGEGASTEWNYSRVKCLGFVDAFVCPHHDAFEKRANVVRPSRPPRPHVAPPDPPLYQE
eukprot:COSAG04_NODE_710_length_10896_cov_24.620543_8_plen_270_part_00